MRLVTLEIVCVAFLLASMIDARGGGRGGGGRSGGSRGSSSRGSSSRGSSSRGSSSTGSSSSSSSSTRTSSSGWAIPSSSSSTSSSYYGWRNPSTSTSSTSSLYGWRNPSTTGTSVGSWRSPGISDLPTTRGGGSSTGASRFLYGGGGGGSGTAMRLGALAGASRFRTRTRYRGGGFSFESNSIEDATVPARTVVLSSSQSGTCNSVITQRNATRLSTTVNVTIYENDNFGGKKEVVQLPPRQCVNVHMIDATWNDKVSSIDPGDACVMIWEHRDCTGRFACFQNGSRGADSLRLVGMNDQLTSLQLC